MEDNKIKDFKFNLSLLELYFKGKYDILNSIREYEDYELKQKQGKEIANSNLKQQSSNIVSIKVKTGEADLGIVKGVEMISDVFDIDILSWFTKIEDIFVRNKWNEETKKFFLMDLIEDNIIDKTCLKDDYNANKDYIISKVFTARRVEKLIAEAEKTKQIDHIFFDSYLKTITERLTIYSKVSDCSKAEYDRRLKELIYRGLGLETKRYLDELAFEKVDQIVVALKRMEDIITTRYEIPRMINCATGKTFMKKWCKHHKKLGHTAKECEPKTRALSLKTKKIRLQLTSIQQENRPTEQRRQKLKAKIRRNRQGTRIKKKIKIFQRT